MKKQNSSKIGGVFEIVINKQIFYGCVISYWNIAKKSKPTGVSFILIENPKSLKRIGKLTLPTGVRFQQFCGENHIGAYWPFSHFIELPKLPNFLYRANVAGRVFQADPLTGQMTEVAGEDWKKYQTFTGGNHGAVEYILEHAKVEFVELDEKNLVL